MIVHTDCRNAYNEAWHHTIIQRHIDCSLLPGIDTCAHVGLLVDDRSARVRFDKMHAYNADMEAAHGAKSPADIEWAELDGHHGIIPVINFPLG
eukprot:jgi/Tetstr1/421474/TSEL_012423.t1